MARLYSGLASLSIIFRSTVYLFSRSLCMSLSYAKRRCLSFLDMKGYTSIRLASQWYAIMMCWFTLRAWMGKHHVSSVYNLLMGVTCMKSSFEWIRGIGLLGELVVGGLGLVGLNPCRFWTRYPMIVAVAEEKYLIALSSVSPGHNYQLPVLIYFNHVDRTGYPDAARK